MIAERTEATPGGVMGLNGYQWAVLFAAWLGWGFDVFDGLLFNYVAPNCVPTLLHIPLGTPAAKAASQYWTGLLTSVLLLSWAAGGVLFGRLADRIGRTKTLLLTMLLYALGTAACAFAPNICVLLVCRIIGGLGIGGEWAAGAAMVAEVVPERRRVEAGALLYTSAPVGLFLATFVVHEIARVLLPGQPGSLLALHLPLRPHPRRRRPARPPVRARAGAVAERRPTRPPRPACPNCSPGRTDA